MSPFEYVIVLISLILGLGITTILTGIAEWIKHIRTTTFYSVHIIWVLVVFVLHIYEWWEAYSLQSINVWGLPMFLFVILYPIDLYILAHLLFPKDLENFNAKDYYFENFEEIFSSVLVLNVLAVIHNIVIEGRPWLSQAPIFLIFTILSSVLISRTKNITVHLCVAVFLLLLLSAVLIFTKDTLLLKS